MFKIVYFRPPGFKEVVTDDDGFETEIIEFRNAVSRLKSKLYKGSCHLRFSGIRPLRGGGVPPFSAKEKNLLFFTLIFR